MVTALNEAADFERGVQAGTDDFLTKPVNKIELLCRIRSILRVRHLKTQLDRTLAYVAEYVAASRESTDSAMTGGTPPDEFTPPRVTLKPAALARSSPAIPGSSNRPSNASRVNRPPATRSTSCPTRASSSPGAFITQPARSGSGSIAGTLARSTRRSGPA